MRLGRFFLNREGDGQNVTRRRPQVSLQTWFRKLSLGIGVFLNFRVLGCGSLDEPSQNQAGSEPGSDWLLAWILLAWVLYGSWHGFELRFEHGSKPWL